MWSESSSVTDPGSDPDYSSGVVPWMEMEAAAGPRVRAPLETLPPT